MIEQQELNDKDSSTEVEVKLQLSKIVSSPNIAELLSEEQLTKIGNTVYEEWLIDKNSRSEWEQRNAEAMKLALQVVETKTFPWENCSNVKFPLVTMAALQFHSRAYPGLIPDTSIVKARIMGDDLTGEKEARAKRVSSYMSYQVLEEDECWEENMDKVLLSEAIMGSAFKKTYFDSSLGHNVSEHVLAKDLYIPYFAKSLEKASRITQVIYLSSNDLLTKQRNGFYSETNIEIPPTLQESSALEEASQEAQGVIPQPNDLSAPYEILEQHRYLDLDDDEYQEPYIVTIRKDTKQVLRIVARFTTTGIKRNSKREITYISPDHFFTKFGFIPSPDGGIYDLGFGILLGPTNESINTILNQLIDAGTMSISAGGFLGRGVKLKSGDNSFKPFEWKRVDSTGEDLRKGIVNLPVREPSQVLFQLVSLLIDYGERIGMAVDPLVGVNPGQNTPAETSRSMVAEGQRVFGAIFKRTYRSLKEEFRKLYKLNSIYLNDETKYFSMTDGNESVILRQDFFFDSKDILPAADPNMITDAQKIEQALTLKAYAAQSPHLYNTYQVEKKALQALKISDIDSYLPDPKGPNALPAPTPDPDIVIATMKLEFAKLKLDHTMHMKLFQLENKIEETRADIALKESQAMLARAQAGGVVNEKELRAIELSIEITKQKQTGLLETLKMLKELEGVNNGANGERLPGVETTSSNT
jgi:chaperonin GroES